MKISCRELKSRTGQVVKAVRNGEVVILVWHGKAIARITPVGEDDFDERWSQIRKECSRVSPQEALRRLRRNRRGRTHLLGQ